MIRLLIVEDEENARIGLRNILKKIPDLEIYTATDGREGYVKAMKLSPEFIISDIHMPVWTGLTMIEKLREKGYSGSVYFLTGYAEFEYAQTAMHYQAVDYILKPVVPSKLTDLLVHAIKTLKKEKGSQHPRKHHLVNEEDEELLQHQLSACGYTGYFLAAIYMEQERHLPEALQEALLKKENLYLLTLPDKHCRGILIGFRNHMINHNAIAELADLLNPYEHLATVYEILDSSQSGPVPVSPSSSSVWNQEYEKLQNAIFWTITYESTFLPYHPSMEQAATACTEDAFFVKQMQKALCEGSYQTCQHVLNKKIGQMKKKGSHPKHIIMTAVSGLIKADSKQAYLEAVNHMSCARTFHEITSLIDSYFSSILPPSSVSRYSKFIQNALLEIESSFKEPITLSSTADRLGITPQYLSRLFMKELSSSYNDYLTSFRIKRAKELLVNSSMKINAIAAAVGYPDAKYFCTLFKKETGVTPNQYRGSQ